VKGERGAAGELKGVFLRDNPIGKIEKNTSSGVYGSVTNKQIIDKLIKIETGEAKVGSAKIVSTVEGKESKEYDISIVKCDFLGENKNFVIKIADEELLDITGGIVQGMSGSPIIQNGKLVGAVTHVFINDPTRGFGISINNMIKHIA
jgi:stage IV sporulation protein B